MEKLIVKKYDTPFDLVQCPGDASWYWCCRGTYDFNCKVNKELSGAHYFVPSSGEFFRNWDEIECLARLLRREYIHLEIVPPTPNGTTEPTYKRECNDWRDFLSKISWEEKHGTSQ